MTDKIRWGILSTGWIAREFAAGLKFLPDAELLAVGSRAQTTADAFGDEYDIPRRYDSYQAVADDPDVDVVYVATPHHLHKPNTLMCLEAGKPVLVEKSFALNAAEAAEMIQKAREKELFLMEALWSRFLPSVIKMREILKSGVLGEIKMFQADFGFKPPYNPTGRLFNPQLAGGALLDVGIYPVTFAVMVLGLPDQIASVASLGQTGVDEQFGAVFNYDHGPIAVLAGGIIANLPREALITGTKGSLRLHKYFWYSERLTLTLEGQDPQVIETPIEGSGYKYEAAEVMACLRTGKLESELMSLDESLAIMGVMDHMRAQWGLKYPMEQHL